jgi:hypothetical protein
LAGLLDDAQICGICSLAGRVMSGERKHRSRSHTPRTLTTNGSRLNLLACKMGLALIGFNRMPVA